MDQSVENDLIMVVTFNQFNNYIMVITFNLLFSLLNYIYLIFYFFLIFLHFFILISRIFI